MNNIIANTATGISVDAASSAKTVLVANLYQGNTSNGVDTSGTAELDGIQLGANDPLFVNAANGDFYLAEKSRAIDSSLNSLPDRPTMIQIDAPLGIPAEPLIAPTYDELGQLALTIPSCRRLPVWGKTSSSIAVRSIGPTLPAPPPHSSARHPMIPARPTRPPCLANSRRNSRSNSPMAPVRASTA